MILSSIKFCLSSAAMMLLISCAPKSTEITTDSKKAEPTKEVATQEKIYTEGTVTSDFKEKGCDFLIRVKNDSTSRVFSAINLGEKYKKDGAKISFIYRLSRAPRKGPCRTGVLIYLDEVK